MRWLKIGGSRAATILHRLFGHIEQGVAFRLWDGTMVMLGGALAILLSVLLYAIDWAQGGIAASQLASLTTVLVIDVVLGAALWVSPKIGHKNLMNSAIVAGVVSIVLLAFGGLPGTIGGVIGLLGAILAAANPYLPWSKHT